MSDSSFFLDRRQALRLLGLPAIAPVMGALPIPAWTTSQTGGTRRPDVELLLRAAPHEVPVLAGAPTRVWQYSATVERGAASTATPIPGSYLGPVLRFTRGQRVRIRFQNDLPEPSIVHWHGLDVPESSDGHPRLAVAPGQQYVYEFDVDNRAGTYWYHPHPHMRTAAQAYHGLAGLIVVSDREEAALELPTGEAELLCVLQDRRFDSGNQLVYAAAASMEMGGRGGGRGMGRGMGGGMAQMMETMNGWLGDRLLVNGAVATPLTVARRTYRIRFLNGSNARFYKLAWDDNTPFSVIGGDGGLMERAVTKTRLTLAPGQRADVLVDLSGRAAGSSLRLRSVAFPASAVGRAGMMGETAPVPQGAPLEIWTLNVSNATGPRVRLPEKLSAAPESWQQVESAPVRRIPLTFMRMEWLIAGRVFDMQAAASDETVDAGSTHVWEFRNEPNPMGMAMAHPMHMHGRQFRVLSRSGAANNPLQEGFSDSAPTDTVVVCPGETVRVQVTFSGHRGLFLYHCHILEHEDMGMMRNFRIS